MGKLDSAITDSTTVPLPMDAGSKNAARQAVELLSTTRPQLPGQFSEHLPAFMIVDPTKLQEKPNRDETKKEVRPGEKPLGKDAPTGFKEELEKRHELFAKDANAMRKQLVDSKAIEKLQALSSLNDKYSVEFQGTDGKNLRLTNALGTGVFVVTSEDKVYLLNDKHPELDTVLERKEAADQQIPKVGWSANPALATEMKSMITDSLLALNQEARTDNTSARSIAESRKRGMEQLDTSVHILNFASKEGLMQPIDYAQRLEFAGMLAAHNLSDKSKGHEWMQQANAVFQREAGPQDEATLASFLKLSRLDTEMKNPAEANLNLHKAIASLEKIDGKPEGALSLPVSLDRQILVDQLKEMKTPEARKEADIIQKRAYDMVLKAPESEIFKVPSGLSSTRHSLIREYTFDHRSELGPLLDQAAKAVEAPNKLFDAEERAQIALRYLDIGSADKATSVLDKAFKSIEATEQKDESNSTKHFRERLTLDSYLSKLEGTDWLHQTRLSSAKALERLEQSGITKEETFDLRNRLIGKLDDKNEYQLKEALLEKQIDASGTVSDHAHSDTRSWFENTLAELNSNAGDYDKAAKHYEASAKISPPTSHTLNALADVYDKLGRNDEAATKRKEARAVSEKLPPGVHEIK